MTASAGIALGRGGETAESLLRDVQGALHRARERGGARFEFSDPITGSRLREQLQLAADLRRALREGQLRLVYQPIFETEGLALIAVEALLRWDHPERGAVSPADFISGRGVQSLHRVSKLRPDFVKLDRGRSPLPRSRCPPARVITRRASPCRSARSRACARRAAPRSTCSSASYRAAAP